MDMFCKVEIFGKSFYDELKGEWDMHSTCDLVMCLGDINGFL